MCDASSAISGRGVSPRPPGPPSTVGTKAVTNRPPKILWSTNRSCSGIPSAGLRLILTFRCFSSGTTGSCISSCPLIPRCAISATLGSSSAGSVSDTPDMARGIQRNLPRRTTSSTVACSRFPTKSSVPRAWRRMERGSRTSTPVMVRPRTHRAKPRRTTSTSGSSGIRVQAEEGPAVVGSKAVRARQASAAASCSASFLEWPEPRP
ncbi:hypothetical protein D3C73_1051420 [compost metagenome]